MFNVSSLQKAIFHFYRKKGAINVSGTVRRDKAGNVTRWDGASKFQSVTSLYLSGEPSKLVAYC